MRWIEQDPSPVVSEVSIWIKIKKGFSNLKVQIHLKHLEFTAISKELHSLNLSI